MPGTESQKVFDLLDERRSFSAAPDTFDPDRHTRGHLAFGYGTHQCLGQSLARVELQIALPTLLRRLANLRPAVPLDQIAFRNNTITYAPRVLPIAW
jgi:cytochrome P450